MPGVLVSQYLPVKARSVPFRRRTWYCSGESRARHCSSSLVTSSGMGRTPAVPSPPGSPDAALVTIPLEPVAAVVRGQVAHGGVDLGGPGLAGLLALEPLLDQVHRLALPVVVGVPAAQGGEVPDAGVVGLGLLQLGED